MPLLCISTEIKSQEDKSTADHDIILEESLEGSDLKWYTGSELWDFLTVWRHNQFMDKITQLQHRWKIPNLPASVFSTPQGSSERKAQGSWSAWQIGLQCLIKPEVIRKNGNPFPLWEHAWQATL